MIAIISRSCILPGSLSPQALWKNLIDGRDLLSAPDPERWGVDPALAMETSGWNHRAGYVQGFQEVFDPSRLKLDADYLNQLDPLFHWTLHTAHRAYQPVERREQGRLSIVVGNLSLPTEGLSRWAEAVWRDDPEPPHPHNRSMSGLPAQLIAPALDLDPAATETITLDAACASSLYALHIGCQKLRRGDADLVLAGATNRANPLFLHIGFQALQALSPTGQSRPFHRQADGLIPTEGAAFVGLKRLQDALDHGDHIHGVIRDVGLSNDGRSEGFLAPAGQGQVRAITAAYNNLDLDADDLDFIECHATGTAVGDGRELQSLQRALTPQTPLTIGSHKANMGHSITVAGMAGLLKILGAMEHDALPPTIHCDDPIDALTTGPFDLVTEARPWSTSEKTAALSAFGFGGNNSHLVVQNLAATPRKSGPMSLPGCDIDPSSREIVVVGLDTSTGLAQHTDDYQHWLLQASRETTSLPDGDCHPMDELAIPLDGLRFPPRDLEEALPQQVALLQSAIQATEPIGLGWTDPLHTGVFAGMQTDPDIARHGLRARAASQNASRRDAIAPALTAPAVTGALPNIVANRINAHFDLGGHSFVTSGSEDAGVIALAEAKRAIEDGHLDTAIVGAVEMATADAHRQSDADPRDRPLVDAAVTLVVTHRTLADEQDLPILAEIHDIDLNPSASKEASRPKTPVAHSATGLLDVASAIVLPSHALPRCPSAPRGIESVPTIATHCHIEGSTSAPTFAVHTTLRRTPRPVAISTPKVYTFDLHGRSFWTVADSESELEATRKKTADTLRQDAPLPTHVYPARTPLEGDVAQVFTGAAAAYHGMGTALSLAFPELVTSLQRDFEGLEQATRWLFHPNPSTPPSPTEKLFGSTILSQWHSRFLDDLSLSFDAAIGLSSGETNAVFATGVWDDFDGLMLDFEDAAIFTHHLGANFQALVAPWERHLPENSPPSWATYRILGSLSTLKEALENEPLVHLLIIHADGDAAIGGHPPAVDSLVAALDEHQAFHLDYDIAVHCPEVRQVESLWRKVHTRPVNPTGIRLYGHGFGGAYEPTSDNIAQALYAQATQTIDFRQIINQAYADGVRIFVEHGPRSALRPWINATLGDRPHHVVSLDDGNPHSLQSVARAIAQLKSIGVDVDHQRYNQRLQEIADHRFHASRTDERTLYFPAHPTPVELSATSSPKPPRPPMNNHATPLPKPPPLPPVNTGSRRTEGATSPQNRADFNHTAPRHADGATSPQHHATSPQHHADPPPTPARDQTALPPYFHHQQQAFHHYLQTIESQSRVHQAFIDQMQRAWSTYSRGELPPAPSTDDAPPPTPTSQISPKNGADVAPSVRQEPVLSPDPSPSPTSDRPRPTGPTFSREDLRIHASGSISRIFGPLFEKQDRFPRQVRMPEPPLLLADRVVGLDAKPGVVGQGTVWTETDITADAWYLHRGHIPAGVMIEAGQADLFLISYMGADFENEGRRIYRLLGCTLTYRKGLPQVGDRLEYDIHIDDHARQGDVRIFFFHYDCRVDDDIRLSVRNGQAGFFTDEELRNSMGILWTPEDADFRDGATLDPPRIDPQKIPRSLSFDQVQTLADGGDPRACFGEGYERLCCHRQTPRMHHGKMCIVGDVEAIEPNGGPLGRGYMRTHYAIDDDAWFFDGHFKDDPCMPGTLMFEGGMQVMSLYMIAMGYTLDRDGWRFEPVPDVEYDLRCRGQATPEHQSLVYEIYVEEIIDGDQPTLVADILATVDGLKAFHCRGMQMRLVPDTPMGDDLRTEGATKRSDHALKQGSLIHDAIAMRATGEGPATLCVGPAYARFDGPPRMPRLPADPYQFMSRVTAADAPPSEAGPGDSATAQYDIPSDAWYFEAGEFNTMPAAIVMEAALQPCGWLSLCSSAITASSIPLYYRNLDGQATLHRPITPDDQVFETRTTMTRDVRSGAMAIQSFDVQCYADGELIFEMDTTFGFFPWEALQNQAGLPVDEREARLIGADANLDLPLDTPPHRPQHPWPTPRLRMIDRLTLREERTEGATYRTEKAIDPGEWFFKAHFYQDPVMPGSLGIEAMLQTLKIALLDHHPGSDIAPVSPQHPEPCLQLEWTYRGQVPPESQRTQVLLTLDDLQRHPTYLQARADASLWVDGLKIYAATLTERFSTGES